MSPEITAALMVILRYCMAGVFVWLANHGLIAPDASGTLLDPTVQIVAGIIGFLLTLSWGLWRSRLMAKIHDVARSRWVTSIHAAPEIAAAAPSDKVVPVPPAQP